MSKCEMTNNSKVTDALETIGGRLKVKTPMLTKHPQGPEAEEHVVHGNPEPKMRILLQVEVEQLQDKDGYPVENNDGEHKGQIHKRGDPILNLERVLV